MSRKHSDRSVAVEGHKLLAEVNKQLLADPRLWALQDDHPVITVLKSEMTDPIIIAKLESFAYLILNIFEILLVVRPGAMNKREKAEYDTWRFFFHDTVAKSSIIRRLLEDPAVRRLYGSVLLAEYQQVKKQALKP